MTLGRYQLRIYLPDELVENARLRSDDPALGQLPEILQKHGASMKSQFDAFAEYVVETEKNGTEVSALPMDEGYRGGSGQEAKAATFARGGVKE